MSDLLSDHLKETRGALQRRSSIGLFMLPGQLGSFIRRMNTLVAMAEEQEAELRLAQARAAAVDLDGLPDGSTILRFPVKVVVLTRPSDGGDAA